MKDLENDHLHASLPEALFDLHLWDQLSLHACAEIARIVEYYLPPSFRFLHVETFAANQEQHQVALFEWKPSANHPPYSFSLIPGATTTLGYDRTQRLVPQDKLVQDWLDSHLSEQDLITEDAELLRDCFPLEYEQVVYTHKYEPLSAHMDQVLSPLRKVTISPFLLEVTARSPQEIFVGNQRYSQRRVMGARTWVKKSGGCWPPRLSHAMVVNMLAREGFRLPTSDEWEYACAAGSRTLFYWGNGSFDPLSKDPYPFPPTPNAFGLSIAQDPYDWEFCAEERIMRGGDGGSAACGCEGWLAETLPLASAYVHWKPGSTVFTEEYGVHVRRHYDLIRRFSSWKEKA